MKKEDFRITRTKTGIKTAFLELLSEKALRDITIKEITDKAQCNRNTFYLHYADKYDLIEKLCDSSLERMKEAIYQTYHNYYESSEDWYADIANRCLDTIETDISFYQIVLGNSRYPDYAGMFQRLIVDFVFTGLEQYEKTSKQKRLEIECSTNGLVGVVKYWLANIDDYSKDEISTGMFDFVVKVGTVIFGK